MRFNTLFSDEPKDKVSVLNKQKQMTADAQSLSYEEWNKKYGGMDEGDIKVFMPGRVYEGKGTYEMFKGFNTGVYDKRIATEVKRIEGEKKADELLTKDANQKAGYLKNLMQTQATYDRLSTELPTKYNYDLNENLDPVEYVKSGMIREAEERIKSKKGVGLTGDPKNDMVCIKGVCTLAANQGVDFKGAFGGYKDGVDTDEQGRMIPQYNPYFSESYDKAGFEKLPKGEKPKKGDFVQYYQGGKPKHMELVLGGDNSSLETFNNYELYNTYREDPLFQGEAGRSKRYLNNGNAEGWDDTVYYRVKPETATAALSNNTEYTKKVEGKKAYEASEDKKAYDAAVKFLSENNNTDVLGEDQGLLQDIIKGVQSGKPKEEVIKAVIPKSKNAKLIERVISNLY